MKGENKKEEKNVETAGYYIYPDGMSFYGKNIMHFGSFGVKATEEIHKKSTEDKKIWYNENKPKEKVVEKEEHEKKG